MMFIKFTKTRLQLSIFFTTITVVLYLTSTGKHSVTPSHYRLSLPTRFHVGECLFNKLSFYRVEEISKVNKGYTALS